MRILFLNYEYPPLGGGAGNATEYLMREFAKDDDLEVDGIVSAVDNVASEESLGGNVRLYRVPIGDKRNSLKGQSAKELITYAVRALSLGKKLMRERRYDAVHAFFTVPCGAVAWQLEKEFHVPYIVSLRGSDVPGYSKKYKALYFFIKPLVRSIWARASAVVSNSEGLKKLALETKPEQKITVIYNGVDTEVFVPSHIPVASREVFTVLCASRLEARKGFRYVIEAIALLHKKYPQLRLVIAGGDGNAGDALRALVAEKGLETKVTFSGQYDRESLVRLQQEVDVFALPSFNEGMSNSLLEAMAGGLPVLMTPTGGAEELVRDGENGFLVPFADANAIAEKLEIALGDPQRTQAMGRASRALAETLSWDAVAREYKRTYSSLNI